jgi:predicted metal-dependent HD superfamily phosphohydrolase
VSDKKIDYDQNSRILWVTKSLVFVNNLRCMMSLIAQATRMVQPLYPATGYHTFGHVSDVLDRSIGHINRLRRYGIPINEQAVRLGVLFHDVLYGLPASDFFVEADGAGHYAATKEEVARVVARRCLVRLQAPAALIEEVDQIIAATHADTHLMTTEQSVMAAADLDIACPYEKFQRDSEALRAEAAQLSGRSYIAPRVFYPGAVGVLANYLRRRIRLTPEYYDTEGVSAFHSAALGNIATALRRWFPRLQVVGELGCGQQPIILDEQYRIDDETLYVGTDHEEQLRKALTQVRGSYQAAKLSQPMAIVVPSEVQTISMPANFCDTFYLKNVWLRHLERDPNFRLSELARVLKPGGILYMLESYQPHGSATDLRDATTFQRQLVEIMKPIGFMKLGDVEVQNGWGVRFSH